MPGCCPELRTRLSCPVCHRGEIEPSIVIPSVGLPCRGSSGREREKAMNGKALILLVLAVLCGLGAMFGTNRMLSKQKKQAGLEMQDVLVAARDLKVEEVVKPDMVKLTQMPKANVSAGHLHLDQGRRGPLGPDQDARRRADPGPQARRPREARRAWSRGSPRGCGPSPSRSTSTPASRGSSSPTTASTWSRSRPGPTARPRPRRSSRMCWCSPPARSSPGPRTARSSPGP